VESKDQHDDYCDYCEDGGNLLCCDLCTAAFHLHCLGLDEDPIGEWQCPHCVQEQEEVQESKHKKKKVEVETQRTESAKPKASTPRACVVTKALKTKAPPGGKPLKVAAPRRGGERGEEREGSPTKRKRPRVSHSCSLVCSLSFAEQIALATSQSEREAKSRGQGGTKSSLQAKAASVIKAHRHHRLRKPLEKLDVVSSPSAAP